MSIDQFLNLDPVMRIADDDLGDIGSLGCTCDQDLGRGAGGDCLCGDVDGGGAGKPKV